MELEGTAFVAAIYSITLPDGDLVDVIELGDGRVIAIDGEQAVLHDSIDDVIELPNLRRPSILL
jgi:hypothetical protein